MPNNVEQESVLNILPSIINGQGKTLLYIGASKYRSFMLVDFINWGYKIDVLEIWPTNVIHIQDAYGVNAVQGDVVWLDLYFKGPYDVAFWWHGPEHVEETEFYKVLNILKKMSKVIILGCPSGESPQETVYDNPFERHKRSIYPVDLEKLGFSTKVIQRIDMPDNITALFYS